MKRIVDSNFDLSKLKASNEANPYKKLILDYFNAHTQNAAYASSTVIDIISNTDTRIPRVLYNDGEYQWSSDLAYHFEKYNIKLNDDFVQHVLKKS